MANEDDTDLMQRVTRYGGAGVAFLGVDVEDTYLLIASVFIALIAGSKLGPPGFFVPPLVGYGLTKIYLDWKSGHLPGMERAWLYSRGYMGYSSGLDSMGTIYFGDDIAKNPEIEEQEIAIILEHFKAQQHGSSNP